MRKRLAVTCREGQVVRCLVERGASAEEFEVIALGRPDLDLSKSETISSELTKARPDLIVSAAAYTAIDQAQSEAELAWQINAIAAGEIARSAAQLGLPIIHLSTDHVFDGSKSDPMWWPIPSIHLGHTGVVPIGSAAYPTSTKRPTNSRLDGSKLDKFHSVHMPARRPW